MFSTFQTDISRFVRFAVRKMDSEALSSSLMGVFDA